MISLQASDIFFCIRYDYLQDQNSAGSLFKGLMFCTQYAFLPAFLRFVQNVWKANAGIFFLVYSACMNFFSLNFPLHEFFFCTSPAPPITFLMVRPLVKFTCELSSFMMHACSPFLYDSLFMILTHYNYIRNLFLTT